MQHCLIIDEINQSPFIEDFYLEAKSRGLEIEMMQFNPAKQEFLTFGQGRPSVNETLLKQVLKESLSKRVDVVLCDYDFQLANCDGFSLLQWIRSVKSKTKLVLYSGAGEMKGKFIEDTFQKKPEQIASLIRAKITDVISRDDRKGVLLNLLTGSKFDTDLFLEEELRKYPELKIKNSYPVFEGLTIAQILEYITDSDSKKGFLFKKNILELTIAHLIELEK